MMFKVSRAAGQTHGVVNAAVIQQRHDDWLTLEIGVIGVGGRFADVANSGSVCRAVTSAQRVLSSKKNILRCCFGDANVGGSRGHYYCEWRNCKFFANRTTKPTILSG